MIFKVDLTVESIGMVKSNETEATARESDAPVNPTTWKRYAKYSSPAKQTE